MNFNVEKERCVFAKTGFGDSEYKCDLLSEECDGLKQTKICKFYKKLKKSLTPLMTERLNYAAISIYAAIVNTAKRLV